MMFYEIEFPLAALNLDEVEAALLELGASSITFLDRGDEPVLEPKPGEIRLWSDTLVFALFDRRANRTGSIVAFTVALVLRVGGGEPLLGLPAFISYPEVVPFRTLAAGAGLVLLPLVSRATARWDAPAPLCNVSTSQP